MKHHGRSCNVASPARAILRQSRGLNAAAVFLLVLSQVARAEDLVLPQPLAEAEARRIAVIEKFTSATIAIFDNVGQGGGSGAIVSPEGYAVTNFHVVAPCGPLMKCGLPDGRFVDAVLVGLDPPGDVAVIQLVADAPSAEWPVAEWGDSDDVQVGDEAFVAGNPFLLATDFRPTVTHGIISGTHRYQYPAGTLLEYADCLQTDAAINPGNSGGPLYDGAGRLIGVNGRASFEKRGRVNVGVGYAISANQVRRFLSHLMAGRIVDHASLGATVRSAGRGRVVVDQISTSSDAYRRGLRLGDEILRFADRPIGSANALQNALGTYPPGWRVPIVFRRGYERHEAIVRLDRLHGAAELEQLAAAQIAEQPAAKGSEAPSAAQERYESRAGYANYHFNRLHRDRVLEACRQRSTAPGAEVTWELRGMDVAGDEVSIRIMPQRATYVARRGRFFVNRQAELGDQLTPPGSGGLLAALARWREVVADGPPPAGLRYVGLVPWGDDLQLAECLTIDESGLLTDFYFDSETHHLIGLEAAPDRSVDPCLVHFSEFQLGDSGALPTRIVATRGDEPWLEMTVASYAAKPTPAAEGP